MEQSLTEKQKSTLFWASFLALAATGVAFAYRVMVLGAWGKEFNLTGLEVGNIFGASLWPIAVTMILFSLIVDAVGYKTSMFIACALQTISVVITFLAKDANMLWWAAFSGGLGHGIIEAVINPVCSSIYTKTKTKMLNILHAAWPAGIVVGATVMILSDKIDWRTNAWWMLIPVIIYGIMFVPVKFPVDERVKAKISYKKMLGDVGFLSSSLAAFLLFYEIYRVVTEAPPQINLAIGVGVGVGVLFGLYTRSLGKPLYFILCLLMIPLATTELGTDSWIKELMTPVMGDYAGWAIVLSAFIMMLLRFQAGFLTKRFSPPVILVISSFFSMMGLIALSQVSGAWIFVAFVLYAVGQTFYWPTVLGLTSEQYPEGGAMTLNTISAIGLLSVGIIGSPIIGAFYDNHVGANVKEVSTELYQSSEKEASFFSVEYKTVDKEVAAKKAEELKMSEKYNSALKQSGRDSLRTTALAFPLVMLVCYFLIALYYRYKGGYKAVEL